MYTLFLFLFSYLSHYYPSFIYFFFLLYFRWHLGQLQVHTVSDKGKVGRHKNFH